MPKPQPATDPSPASAAPKAGFQPDPAADRTFVNLHDYERIAAERLAAGPLAYFSGGAMDERTLKDNRAAFGRRRIVPRVMTDVSTVDTTVEVLGRLWPSPIWVCPTAFQRMAHPDGELATARAAAARGITMTLSTSASSDMADVAAVGGPRWYQVYLLADPGARQAMVERAVETGYEALLLTVDLQRTGRRERDIRDGFALPQGVTLPNVEAAGGFSRGESLSTRFVERLTWDDLEWLAAFGLPVLVKGVLHPDDARLALDHGAAGIVVSNHGGRQLDGAIASLDALPAVVEAVAGRGPVLMDGGVRRGTDVLMALALGATAVGIGRPVIWGLAVDGEAGVGRILDLLTAELNDAMALSGAGRLADLTPALIV
ncbi:MAG TPA: alpha-hydroxy acid oxidase [Candidatus Dormibacteraeota bacterium]|nr:alpha-hydroxy acid oxidase [Candidatus Dormibacteraeota bacterium]